jgi:nucleoside-diphosphate-sugar epimerase
VSFSYDHYVEVCEANFLGWINLAETCYKEVPNLKQFIFAGTSEEYGMTLKDTRSMFTEGSELKPNSPYAVSKVATDLYLRYMGITYDFPYTVMRPFNTYGRKNIRIYS